ncbi:MAG: HAD family hydrolase [Helicobacteraceae bacterium]|nr:HAD family hydrolase [Helicobacteraceae bacterium]
MIKLLCLDVDGTLTDGKLHFSFDINLGKSYEIMKSFSVKDGLGIAYWNKIGRSVAIITGRNSPIIEHRAKEIGISYVFMGIKDKGKCVRELQQKLNIDSSACAAIGDDLNDISMFNEVALKFAPNDCVNEISNIAIKLNNNGGDGAIRETIEYILKQEDMYEEFIKYWK